MNKTLALALFVFACLAPGFAASDIVYVAYNGLDTHPCTRVFPCKTITHALTVVNAGGQVIIVGSGTYDNFTITKAVTVAAEPGVVAILDVTNGGTGITVNAGANDRVVIRGLYLNGHASEQGIYVESAGEVSLEECVARNFAWAFIVSPTVPIFVSVKGGVYANAPTSAYTGAMSFCCTIGPPYFPANAAIDGVTVEDGCYGIWVNAGSVTITNSFLSGSISNANCFSGNTDGILAVGGTLVAENNVISGYTVGARIGNTSAYLSSNTITANSTGVFVSPSFNVFTRGNNTIVVANGQNVTGTMTPFSGQ